MAAGNYDHEPTLRRLPRSIDQLSAAQKQSLIAKGNLPRSITSDPDRLRRNLNYQLQLHNQAHDEQQRRRRHREQVDSALSFNPSALLSVNPYSLYAETGRCVRLDEYGDAYVVEAPTRETVVLAYNEWQARRVAAQEEKSAKLKDKQKIIIY
jgi:hypothetical protein